MAPTDYYEMDHTPKLKLVNITSFADVRAGDLVTLMHRGEPHCHRAQPLLCNPSQGTVVLNAGGRYGTPMVCTPDNFVRARGRRLV